MITAIWTARHWSLSPGQPGTDHCHLDSQTLITVTWTAWHWSLSHGQPDTDHCHLDSLTLITAIWTAWHWSLPSGQPDTDNCHLDSQTLITVTWTAWHWSHSSGQPDTDHYHLDNLTLIIAIWTARHWSLPSGQPDTDHCHLDSLTLITAIWTARHWSMLTYTFFMWVKHGCQESQISYFSTVSGWLLVTAQAIPPLTVSKINFLSAFYRLFQFWTTLSTEFIMIIILCTHSEKFQVPHIHNSYTHTHTHMQTPWFVPAKCTYMLYQYICTPIHDVQCT